MSARTGSILRPPLTCLQRASCLLDGVTDSFCLGKADPSPVREQPSKSVIPWKGSLESSVALLIEIRMGDSSCRGVVAKG